MGANYLLWILLVFPSASIAQDAEQDKGRLYDTTVYQDYQTHHFVNITSNNDDFLNFLNINNQSVIPNNMPLTNAHFLNPDMMENSSTILYNYEESTTEPARNRFTRKNDSITLIQIEIIDEKVNISNVNIYNVNSTVINNGDNYEKYNSSSTNVRVLSKSDVDDDNDQRKNSTAENSEEMLVNDEDYIESFNPLVNKEEVTMTNSDENNDKYNSSFVKDIKKDKYQLESTYNEVTTQKPKGEINEKEIAVLTPVAEINETNEKGEEVETEKTESEDKQDKEWNEEVTQYDDEYKTTIIFTNLYNPGEEVTEFTPEINLDKPGEQEEKETDTSSDFIDLITEDDTKKQLTAVETDEGDARSEETKTVNSDIDKELIRISEENALKIERARNQLVTQGLNQLVGDSKLEEKYNTEDSISNKEINTTVTGDINNNEHKQTESSTSDYETRSSISDNVSNLSQNSVSYVSNEERRTTEGYSTDRLIVTNNESMDQDHVGESDYQRKQTEENDTVEKFKENLNEERIKATISPIGLRKVPRKDFRQLLEEKRRAALSRLPSFRNNQTRFNRDQQKPVNKVIQKLIASRDALDSAVEREKSEDIDVYALEYKTRRSWGGCARECDETPMTCRYELTLEWFHTMSKACYSCPVNQTDCFRPHCVPADGVKRTIAVINRSLPGPLIQVCEGDTIVAKVTNHLMESTTTIHWHGQHQFLTPHMDGVPSVSQCPILPGASFTYKFTASQPGTHFYHSHSGVQRGDGAFGAFIVRRIQSKERHRWTYDRDLPEHTMTILDWQHTLGLQTFTYHHLAGGGNKPETILVNGRGIVGNHNLPPASFTVTKGMRYRFRLINAGVLNCPIRLSIDGHRLTIIASDGNDVQPYIVDWLVTYAGERWDFVLEANGEVDNYWMRFIGLMDCDERFTAAHQGAVLHYSNASLDLPAGALAYNASSMFPRLERPPKVLNELNAGMSDGATLVHQLNGLARSESWLASRQPDRKIVLAYDFNPLDNPYFHKSQMYGFSQVIDMKGKIYTPQLNHISLKLPPFPLLTQSNRMTEDMLCTSMDQRVCQQTYCDCTNIININLGDVVEIMLIDQGFVYDANHPFHLHGHSFYVVGMDRLGSNVTSQRVLELDASGQIPRNLGTPPLKDTVTVPDGGYTIIRFLAKNPGYWMLHCHIDFHVEVGMAVVLKIGEVEDFPPAPVGFPTCGDFEPTELNIDDETSDNNEDNRVESSMVRLMDPTVSPGFGSRWKYNTSSSYSVNTSSCFYTAVCLLAILLSST